MEFISSLQGRHDELKPSLFDILAENQLSALLPPSIRYLLVAATRRYPRYLLRILNSFDEIYAIVSLVVERHFLRHYGGTFIENFYGLKRERVLSVRDGEVPRTQLATPGLVREALKLRSTDIWKNLLVVVAVPYLKRKLDESYDIHAAHQHVLDAVNRDADRLPEDATVKQRLMHLYKWFLRRVYPNINAAFWFANLMFSLTYLFDGSKYSSPLLALVRTRVRRMGPADYRAIDEAEQRAAAGRSRSGFPPAASSSQSSPSHSSSAARSTISRSLLSPRAFSSAIIPSVLSSLKMLLPASIFALKFLEWWHASDFSTLLARKAAESSPIPPPVLDRLPSVRITDKPEKRTDGIEKRSDENTDTSLLDVDPSVLRVAKSVVSTSSGLPILTVAVPSRLTNGNCPICNDEIVNPTATPTGYVFCYVCIHQWVDGDHDKQERFMAGQGVIDGDEENGIETGSGSSIEHVDRPFDQQSRSGDDEDDSDDVPSDRPVNKSRVGKWESGKGRCAVTGMVILAGTDGLRRVIV